jgi:hypothetical protein
MEGVYASNDVDKQQKRHAVGMPFLFDTSIVRHAHPIRAETQQAWPAFDSAAETSVGEPSAGTKWKARQSLALRYQAPRPLPEEEARRSVAITT